MTNESLAELSVLKEKIADIKIIIKACENDSDDRKVKDLTDYMLKETKMAQAYMDIKEIVDSIPW